MFISFMCGPQLKSLHKITTYYTTLISFWHDSLCFSLCFTALSVEMGYWKSVFTHYARCDHDLRTLLHGHTVRTEQLILMCSSQVDHIDSDGGFLCRGLMYLSCVTDTYLFKQRLVWCPCLPNVAGRSQLDWIKQHRVSLCWCCVGMWFSAAGG